MIFFVGGMVWNLAVQKIQLSNLENNMACRASEDRLRSSHAMRNILAKEFAKFWAGGFGR